MKEQRIQNIVKLLDDKKAENIEYIDLSKSDYFVDHVIIATTLADKHGLALLDMLKTELKPKGEHFLNVDESDDWIVIDLGDMLIHLMSEYQRKKFNLEEFLKNLKKERKVD